MRTSWGTATDRGLVRALNEDSLLAHPPIFLVADGMGGHAAGDVASRLVIEEFGQLIGATAVTADDVHACFRRAAARVRDTVGAGRVAGTTVAGVAITEQDGGSYWLVFNVGDSRVYRYADGFLVQVSVDHSVIQEMIDRGEVTAAEARSHPERHVITRAVDTASEPEPDYWLIPARVGDRMLICSDGLTGELDDAALLAMLDATTDPQQLAQQLVDETLALGARDNVTVVVVDVEAADDPDDVEITRERPLLADNNG